MAEKYCGERKNIVEWVSDLADKLKQTYWYKLSFSLKL